MEQGQFVLVLVSLGVVEQAAGGEAEDADDFQEGKTASGLLASRLGVGALVLSGCRAGSRRCHR